MGVCHIAKAQDRSALPSAPNASLDRVQLAKLPAYAHQSRIVKLHNRADGETVKCLAQR